MRIVGIAVVGMATLLSGCGFIWWDPSDPDYQRSRMAPFELESPPETLANLRCRDLMDVTQNYYDLTAAQKIEASYIFGLISGYIMGYPVGSAKAMGTRGDDVTDDETIEFAREIGRACEGNPSISVARAVRREHEATREALVAREGRDDDREYRDRDRRGRYGDRYRDGGRYGTGDRYNDWDRDRYSSRDGRGGTSTSSRYGDNRYSGGTDDDRFQDSGESSRYRR